MKCKKYPKRDAIKNYFPMPNEIFHLGLNAGEIALYAFLLKCEDRKTFKCYPSYRTIGRALNISKNTVKKYVDNLCAKRLIDIAYTDIYTKDGKKLNGNLMYTIRPIQEAIDYELEKLYEKKELERRKAEIEKKFNKYMRSENEDAR
ncbi:MAG: helix-turn-helix domain-containing protein [Clostridia bacterium]|nr:helix-turn-helix domain-containing protein [Clostridia bacterium]